MERFRRWQRKQLTPTQETRAPSSGAAPGGAVRVLHGSMSESLELAGMSVGEARGLLRAPYGIPDHATALVNGREPEATQRLAVGDVLEFVRVAGEKGGGHR